MAKRRRLETTSSADLSRIEEQFRSETSLPSLGRGIAPIAQVAAESAAVASPESAAARAARAKAEADAARLQEAETRGLLIAELPIDQIDEAAMIRDRMVMTEEDMQELRLSIAAHGLRLPIEVFETGDGTPPRYGLLSGYRRLHAVRALHALTGDDREFLLFDWLRELLMRHDADRQLFGRFTVTVRPDGLTGTAWGEPIDAARHVLSHEVKAITYHELHVEQTPDGWLAEVIVDI